MKFFKIFKPAKKINKSELLSVLRDAIASNGIDPNNAGIVSVEICRDLDGIINFDIVAINDRIFIGKHGRAIKRIIEFIESQIDARIKINFIETDIWDDLNTNKTHQR